MSEICSICGELTVMRDVTEREWINSFRKAVISGVTSACILASQVALSVVYN